MLTKEQKHEQSVSLRENLADVNTLFLLENHGLNVNDVNVLRAEVRKTDATYKVVKNTVVRLAVEGTEMEVITPFLTGPKVLAFTGGDGVALAKVLKDFIKKHPELRFEHAYLDGQILEATGVRAGLIVHVGCGDGTLLEAAVDGVELQQVRRRRRVGFFDKAVYAPIFIDADDPKFAGLYYRYLDAADSHIGLFVYMEGKHRTIVHFIYMITGQYQYIRRVMTTQNVEILIDCIRRALEPLRAVPGLLGSEDADEAGAEVVEVVGERNVLVEALGVVLGEDEDPAQVRVEAVADGDVDEAVLARDGHGRLRALVGEGKEPGSPTASQDDGEGVIHGGGILPRGHVEVSRRGPFW